MTETQLIYATGISPVWAIDIKRYAEEIENFIQWYPSRAAS